MENPIPERPETIQAQLQWLHDGRRSALLLSKGEEVPVHWPFASMVTDLGLFIYDDERIQPEQITDAVAQNTVGTLLGYGIAAKPDNVAGCVVIRAASGLEKLSVVTDIPQLPKVIEALNLLLGPGDTLRLEDGLRVLFERQLAQMHRYAC
jgi:hypothetical protein